MRILPDDLYLRWPELTARICFAYSTAPHSALGNISPFEIYHLQSHPLISMQPCHKSTMVILPLVPLPSLLPLLLSQAWPEPIRILNEERLQNDLTRLVVPVRLRSVTE